MRRQPMSWLASTLGALLIVPGFTWALLGQDEAPTRFEKAPPATQSSGKMTFQQIPLASLSIAPSVHMPRGSEPELLTQDPASTSSQFVLAREVTREPIQELSLTPPDRQLLDSISPAPEAGQPTGQQGAETPAAANQASKTGGKKKARKWFFHRRRMSRRLRTACQLTGYGLIGVGALGIALGKAAQDSHQKVSGAYFGATMGAIGLGIALLLACHGDIGG
jgi:hypothetical protein